MIRTHINLELAVTDEMINIAANFRPRDCCLVPEKREELTTEGGLDVAGQLDKIRAACRELGDAGIRVSLFIDPDPAQLDAAAAAGASCPGAVAGPGSGTPSAWPASWQRSVSKQVLLLAMLAYAWRTPSPTHATSRRRRYPTSMW